MSRRVYLDHNATTPLDERVKRAVIAALEVAGNPSSLHEEGRRARDVVERARREVAGLVGAEPDEVIFTGGGTEADLLGVVGLYRAARARGAPARVLAPAIEHPAVLGAVSHLAAQGAEAVRVQVDDCGRVDLAHLERELAAGGAAVVAIALANHELGTVQDVAAAAAACARAGALLHVDAVQAAGRIPVDVRALGADALAVSAHKMYGPKGAGALWVHRGIDLAPLAAGGHQERERRPGTENVAGIAGLGAAAALAAAEQGDRHASITAVGRALEDGLAALPGATVHAAAAARVPGTINVRFAGAPGELVVQALDLAGVAASTGAACTSGTVTASPVLLAIGLARERALEAVRLACGRETTSEQVQFALEVLPDILARIRAYS